MQEKACNRCDHIKPWEAFDFGHFTCMACFNKDRRKKYRENKAYREKIKLKRREYYNKMRLDKNFLEKQKQQQRSFYQKHNKINDEFKML